MIHITAPFIAPKNQDRGLRRVGMSDQPAGVFSENFVLTGLRGDSGKPFTEPERVAELADILVIPLLAASTRRPKINGFHPRRPSAVSAECYVIPPWYPGFTVGIEPRLGSS